MSLNSEKLKELFSRSRSGFSRSEVKNVGKSWLSRDICCSVAGHGDRNIVIVGGFCGGEVEISSFLVDFAHEFDDCSALNRRISEFNISALCGGNRIHFLPLLNPDGITVNNAGIAPDNPFYGRVMRMMKDPNEFSQWDANMRGTQLNLNFNYKWIDGKLRERDRGIFSGSPSGYGGEYPESELETSSLCSYCRKISPDIIIEFRAGSGTNIVPCLSDGASEKSKRASRLIYGYTGLDVVDDDQVFYGSFSGWAAREFGSSSVIINVNKDISDQTVKSLKSAILLFCAQ